MVAQRALGELVEALVRAASFEKAADACLGAVLDVAARYLAASPFRDDARLRRTIAHWRPDDAYRGVVIRDADAETAVTEVGDEFLISTAAWQSIAEERCPVAFDVETGQLTLLRGDGAPARSRVRREAVSPHTLSRVQRRGATHLLVLPLRGPGGRPMGMVSVEADCPGAIGRRFIWEEAVPELKLVCDVAAPHLAQLPPRKGGEADADAFLPVVGPTMAPLVRLLRVFARQQETLLLSGITGTGKSRLARWCHEHSPRRERPFEVVDLLAIPDEMQMGALFGWRRGAFTGATGDHVGSVSRAEGGTLFIDEIDKLSDRAQAGLLYLLEERRYRVLGDGPERESDLRFIVGTNADLCREVERGRFREDLYYRINVLAVKLPPLEDRRDEIADWARYMLDRRHAEAGEASEAGDVSLTREAAALLEASPWPGNLRQLDNVLRRAYVLALAERGGAAGPLEVGEMQLLQSLRYENGPATGPSNPFLAVARLVAEAARHEGGFDIDLLSGLRGLVLGEAIRITGSKEEAFRLLGREALVKSRNHHKALQRELERAEELCRALGLASAVPAGQEGDDGR